MGEDKIDQKVFARLHARGIALEQAGRWLGPTALISQVLEAADRFYPFIAQEILKEGE